MILVSVHTDSDKAPTSGTGLYLVVDESPRMVSLLHPVTLVKFDITLIDYRSGFRGEYWPNPSPGYEKHLLTAKGRINERIASTLAGQAAMFSKQGKGFPAQIVRRAIAVLTGKRIEEVPQLKEPSTSPRGFAVRSEKRPGVVDAIAALLETGVSIDEAVAGLKKQFPERDENGMRTTVRCQINRLPAKIGRVLNSSFDKKRGKVFQWQK